MTAEYGEMPRAQHHHRLHPFHVKRPHAPPIFPSCDLRRHRRQRIARGHGAWSSSRAPVFGSDCDSSWRRGGEAQAGAGDIGGVGHRLAAAVEADVAALIVGDRSSRRAS